MGTWVKETDQAIYLMEGGNYLEKIDKVPRNNGEYELNINAMASWFSRSDAPRGMIVAVGINAPEPTPIPAPVSIEITTWPNTVEVEQLFEIAGRVQGGQPGETIQLFIDNQLATSAPKVAADLTWRISYRFFGPGQRTLRLDIAGVSVTRSISVMIPPTMLNLSNSVGQGGANVPADVLAVKTRLLELGFNFFKPGPRVESDLIYAIRLFQSITVGSTQLIGDGRIDVNGFTHQYLKAANAPRWGLMPMSGDGFINHELKYELHDHHDYGVNWLGEAIAAVGKDYETRYRQGKATVSLLAMNDVSLPEGGDTPDHAGHECGNACDVFLPKKNGDYGGTTWWSTNYDRNAARAMLQALKRHPLVTRIYFNDPNLIREGLCQPAGGHDNHIHFEIGAPAMQAS